MKPPEGGTPGNPHKPNRRRGCSRGGKAIAPTRTGAQMGLPGAAGELNLSYMKHPSLNHIFQPGKGRCCLRGEKWRKSSYCTAPQPTVLVTAQAARVRGQEGKIFTWVLLPGSPRRRSAQEALEPHCQ